MNKTGMHAVASSFRAADDSSEHLLVTCLGDVRNVLHQEGTRHDALNNGEKRFPQFAAALVQLLVLIKHVIVMLPPADVPGEGLTGWASSYQCHLPTGVELAAELRQHFWVT